MTIARLPRIAARHRVWRALAFAGIVWAIAAAFYFLQQGQMWVSDRALRSGALPEWIAQPSSPGTDCSDVVKDVPRVGLGAEASKRVRSVAFDLGFAVGAEAAQRSIGGPDSEQNRRLGSAPAQELGLPVPEAPLPRSVTYALTEFQSYIVTDPQCVAALLSAKYSPREDALYRFAAFAGFNVVYRTAAPQLDPLFFIQLRQFGKAAGLPEEVWGAFIDTHADIRGALGRVNGYLKNEPVVPSR